MSGTVNAGDELTSALVGVPNWIPMTPLANSWVNTGAGTSNAQYRKWPLLNSVQIVGNISNGVVTDGTAFFTLPAGYTPATSHNVPALVGGTSGAARGISPQIAVTTGGILEVFGLPTGTTEISFEGWFSLDA